MNTQRIEIAHDKLRVALVPMPDGSIRLYAYSRYVDGGETRASVSLPMQGDASAIIEPKR